MFGLAACGGGGGGGGGGGNTPSPEDTAVQVTGRVRLAGSAPMPQVVIEPDDPAADAFEVRGAYRSEMMNLEGARVRAGGVLDESRRLIVSEYEILEIAGHVPVVGTLRTDDGRFFLEGPDGETVRIENPPDAFSELAGAKIWVIIDERGAVGGYGVIRKR